jgi:hypothetical protein
MYIKSGRKKEMFTKALNHIIYVTLLFFFEKYAALYYKLVAHQSTIAPGGTPTQV